MGAGCCLSAVVGGGGGPWFIFWGWRPFLCVGHRLCSFWGACCHFWAVVLVFEQLSLMVVCWHRCGGRAVVGHCWGCCWCGGSSGGGGG